METNERRVAELVLEQYRKLGKNGKPPQNQWTHLAAFVAVWNSGEISVISLATGTKCLGASEVSKEGHSINDSHAEVLARRALIRFLLLEAQRVSAKKGEQSKLLVEDSISIGRLRLRDDLRLFFFTTYPPCGDGSILPKLAGCPGSSSGSVEATDGGSECVEEAIGLKTRKEGDVNLDQDRRNDEDREKPNSDRAACNNDEVQDDSRTMEPEPKRFKLVDGKGSAVDIYRTGAKCTVDGPQDAKLPGVHYHQLGAWRTKPGRGERTLSMSCSDKLAKWAVMGVQGSLLMRILVEPIYIEAIVVGGRCPYSEESLRRAIIERNADFPTVGVFRLHPSRFTYLDDVPFPHRPSESSASSPSHSSCLWHQGMQKPEVLVDGYKQGVTLAKRHRESSRSIVSRWAIARLVAELIVEEDHRGKSYEDLKTSSDQYSEAWKKLKLFYKYWIHDSRKAEAHQFHFDDSL